MIPLPDLRQRPLGEAVRLLQTAGEHLRLPQGETSERLKAYHGRSHGLLQRLREQRHSVGDTPGQDVHRAQRLSHPGEIEREVRVLTGAHSMFEQVERHGEIALAEGQHTTPPIGHHEAPGVSDRLSNPQPFVPESTALSERAQLGMALGEFGTGVHSGEEPLAEALVAPRSGEGHHGLPEEVDGPTIVALDLVGEAEILVRQCLQDDLATGPGERQIPAQHVVPWTALTPG